MGATLTLKNACFGVLTRDDGSVRLVLHHGGIRQAIEMTAAEADELGRALIGDGYLIVAADVKIDGPVTGEIGTIGPGEPT